ncbi:hypothetical protein ELS19_13810 [Halogeometricum borinquense]|uniref:Uncharacterized protein n=1 Tax=Halogeometricum borinquense TaxID=60847 RepID=A0A482TDJ4_9EURY|nr:hypothetical protein ELS19_13810 [Halogeometricum borinquense]
MMRATTALDGFSVPALDVLWDFRGPFFLTLAERAHVAWFAHGIDGHAFVGPFSDLVCAVFLGQSLNLRIQPVHVYFDAES